MKRPEILPEIVTRLVFFGTGLNPATISTVVGLPPTRVWYAGEQRGRLSRASDNGWEITEGPARSSSQTAQVERILRTISPNLQELTKVVRDGGVEVVLKCIAYIEEITPELHLSTSGLVVLCRLRADVDIDWIRVDSGASNRSDNVH
jgi:hypothetical protein